MCAREKQEESGHKTARRRWDAGEPPPRHRQQVAAESQLISNTELNSRMRIQLRPPWLPMPLLERRAQLVRPPPRRAPLLLRRPPLGSRWRWRPGVQAASCHSQAAARRSRSSERLHSPVTSFAASAAAAADYATGQAFGSGLESFFLAQSAPFRSMTSEEPPVGIRSWPSRREEAPLLPVANGSSGSEPRSCIVCSLVCLLARLTRKGSLCLFERELSSPFSFATRLLTTRSRLLACCCSHCTRAPAPRWICIERCGIN